MWCTRPHVSWLWGAQDLCSESGLVKGWDRKWIVATLQNNLSKIGCNLHCMVHFAMHLLASPFPLPLVTVTCPICMTDVTVAGSPHKAASSDCKTILVLWLSEQDTVVWICALEEEYVMVQHVTTQPTVMVSRTHQVLHCKRVQW